MIQKEPANRHTYGIVVGLAKRLEESGSPDSAWLFRVASRLAFERAEFARSREFALKATILFERLAAEHPDSSHLYLAMAGMAAKDAGETSRAMDLFRREHRVFNESIRRDPESPLNEILRDEPDEQMITLESGVDGVYPKNKAERIIITFRDNNDRYMLYSQASSILLNHNYLDAAIVMEEMSMDIAPLGDL